MGIEHVGIDGSRLQILEGLGGRIKPAQSRNGSAKSDVSSKALHGAFRRCRPLRRTTHQRGVHHGSGEGAELTISQWPFKRPGAGCGSGLVRREDNASRANNIRRPRCRYAAGPGPASRFGSAYFHGEEVTTLSAISSWMAKTSSSLRSKRCDQR
jgi:hypothetical protein